MTRKITVTRAHGQGAAIPAGTAIYGGKRIKAHGSKTMGYYDLTGKDASKYYLLGVTMNYVSVEESRFVVIQGGNIHVKLDPMEQIGVHDNVKIVPRNGGSAFVKAETVDAGVLVEASSRASEGFANLTNAIIDEAAAALGNNNAAAIANAKRTVSSSLMQSFKAKDRLGRRNNSLSATGRVARNGANLLIKAIREMEHESYGTVIEIGKDNVAKIRTHKL